MSTNTETPSSIRHVIGWVVRRDPAIKAVLLAGHTERITDRARRQERRDLRFRRLDVYTATPAAADPTAADGYRLLTDRAIYRVVCEPAAEGYWAADPERLREMPGPLLAAALKSMANPTGDDVLAV